MTLSCRKMLVCKFGVAVARLTWMPAGVSAVQSSSDINTQPALQPTPQPTLQAGGQPSFG